MLREILAQPQATAREEMGDAYSMKDGRHGSEDSGYFSRRDSKVVSTGDGKRDSVLTEEMEEIAEEIENNNDDGDGEIAEEADDEGAGGEDPEQDEEEERHNSLLLGLNDNNRLPHRKSIIAQRPQPHTHTHPPTPSAPQHNQTPTPAPEHRTQIQIGTRFISPRMPASPRLSADEATVAVAGRGRDPVG